MPWSRREDGRIAQRWFGGYSYPRATFAEDKVGFHEMQTLYDTCTKYPNITFYQEWFATSLLVEQGEFRGITAIEMKTGSVRGDRRQGGDSRDRRGGQALQLRNLRAQLDSRRDVDGPAGQASRSRTWSSSSSIPRA